MARWARMDLHLDPSKITEFDIVYFAGLFDGEGCVRVESGRRAAIQLGMTDLETITWLGEKFAGHMHVQRKGDYVPFHHWTLARLADVEWLVTRMLPYARLKRPRLEAALVLVEYTKLRPGLTGDALCEWNAKLPEVTAPLQAKHWRATEQPEVAKTL